MGSNPGGKGGGVNEGGREPRKLGYFGHENALKSRGILQKEGDRNPIHPTQRNHLIITSINNRSTK